MLNDGGRMTSVADWDKCYAGTVRMRLGSPLIATNRNLWRILRAHIKPGMRVMEFGFAPGKNLAYVAAVLKAEVAGIDYSKPGVDIAKRLFSALALNGDLRCNDLFEVPSESGAYDFVYSMGLVEHFHDPRPLVRLHAERLKPGGTGVIIVPNYNSWYGSAQRYFDPDNLAVHNLNIMSPENLLSLAPADLVSGASVTHEGRIDPSLISFDKKLPSAMSRMMLTGLNVLGTLQPRNIRLLCPWVALTFQRVL